MDLQKKTLLILVIFIIGLIVVLSLFVTAILLANYSSLEKKYVEQDLTRAAGSFDDDTASLSAIVSDWGPWDDTYNFVNGKKPDYVATNLLPETYANLRLNIVIITNRTGGVVYAGAYDIRNETMVAVPASLTAQLVPGSPLMNMTDPRGATAGIIMLPKAPVIVASRPIVHTDFSGTPQGVVIMGRYLDSAEIARLGQLTVPTLAFTPVNDPLVPPALLSAPGSGGGSRPTMVQPVNRTAVSGYVLFRDIYGRNALVLSITEPRDIYNEGLGTAFQFVIIILGAGLLLGIVVIILLDRLVLARIGSLALQVSSIGQDRDLTRRVAIGGSDQLADLGSVINRMLETIEKTQNSLVQSEARFRELAELLPQTVFEMDMQGSLTFINDAGAEIFGIDDEKIQEGTNVREYLIPEDLERMRQGLAVVMAGAKSSGEIYHLKRLDGTLMSAIVYTSPVHRDGTITGFRGIVTDITDRVKLEEALIESEEKYRALTENTADIPFLTDMQGVLQYISPQIGRFGFGTSEIVNKNILDLVYPDDRFSVGNYLKTEIGSNRRQGHVFRITEKSGTIHWMEANTTIKRGNGGRPEGIYGTLRDITDRKRDEDALRLANRKLNLMNTITRHDILNTITGLLGCVDMAASVTDKVEHDALLAQIKEQARIIQRQITFTREYQEVGIHAPVWQNLNEILERVIGNFSRTGITFVMDLDHMEIYADPLLEKVFYNLIDNALRYGKTLTTIRFYNQISDKGMAIICDDDGAGIPAKEKERIFEQGVGQNTGMGLFLTREMLIITGITLRETGTFGQGARFEMLVPNSAWRLVRAGTER